MLSNDVNYIAKGFWIFFLLWAFFFSSCKKPYSADNAKKMLIAADHDLMRTVVRLTESQAYAALELLYQIEDVPLPGRFIQSEGRDSAIYFDFDVHKGYYKEVFPGQLQLINYSDSLIINFLIEKKSQQRAVFVLERYREEMTAFGNNIPVVIKGHLLVDEKRIMEISHDVKLKQGLPLEVKHNLRMNHLRVNFSSELKPSRKNGRLKANLLIDDLEKNLLKVNLSSEVRLNENGSMIFGDKTIRMNVYPLVFQLKSSYSFENINLKTFTDDFNHSSQMLLADLSGREIGNLNLAYLPEHDRIGIILIYSDGSSENLENIMKSLHRILNFKIVSF